MKPMVVAVIPAFNEEKTIAGVAREASKYCDKVIVVDDGSTDGTQEALRDSGVDVVYLKSPVNSGQGSATRMGFEKAVALGADIVVTLDGDGQHDPSQIPLLLKALENSETDIAIGSRFLPECSTLDIPTYRKAGMVATTWLLNIGHRKKIYDSLLCFRAFKRHVITEISIEENGFGHCPEMLIKAMHKNFGIEEIPANCFYPEDPRRDLMHLLNLGVVVAWKILFWRLKVGC